jgi:hypothetical protein
MDHGRREAVACLPVVVGAEDERIRLGAVDPIVVRETEEPSLVAKALEGGVEREDLPNVVAR